MPLISPLLNAELTGPSSDNTAAIPSDRAAFLFHWFSRENRPSQVDFRSGFGVA